MVVPYSLTPFLGTTAKSSGLSRVIEPIVNYVNESNGRRTNLKCQMGFGSGSVRCGGEPVDCPISGSFSKIVNFYDIILIFNGLRNGYSFRHFGVENSIFGLSRNWRLVGNDLYSINVQQINLSFHLSCARTNGPLSQ